MDALVATMCEKISLARGSIAHGCHMGVILEYYGRLGGGWQVRRINNQGYRMKELVDFDRCRSYGNLGLSFSESVIYQLVTPLCGS